MLKGTLSAATPETRAWIVLMQLVTVAFSPKTKTELVLPSATDHSLSHGVLLKKYPSALLIVHSGYWTAGTTSSCVLLCAYVFEILQSVFVVGLMYSF